MRYELWHSGHQDFTLCTEGPEGDSARALLEDDAALLHVFEVDTWEQAMAQYHTYMDWGRYHPM